MISIPWSSLRFRLIAGALIGLGLGLGAAGWMLISVYQESVTRAFDARLEALDRILVASADVGADGSLSLPPEIGDPLFETTYSGWYWQISSAAATPKSAPVLLRSKSLFDYALEVPASPSVAKTIVAGPRGQRLRVVRLRVTLPRGPVPFDFMVAGDYGNVRAQIGSYIGTLAIALAFLASGIVFALVLQVRFALAPLRHVRSALAAVRDGTAANLEGEFPIEVEPLVIELNALLAHNKAVLERARTQVGNLAHALKTPLSVLRNEVDATGEHLPDAVRRETDTMRRQIDHYLSRARAAAAANVLRVRTPILPRAAGLVRTMGKIHRDIDFELDCPPDLAFRGEANDLDEILGNLLDNGGKWAASRVEIVVRATDNHRVRITVDDDGTGLDETEREAVSRRGQRLDETVPGSGLGLSIVRELVGLYGGELSLARSPLGGLRVVLLLPVAGGN